MLPSSAGTIATSLAARLVGDGDLVIRRLDTIEAADAHCLTFIRDDRFARRWLESRAGAALIAERDAGLVEGAVPAGRALLVVADADLAMLELLKLVTPPIAGPPAGVHPTAFVDPAAEVHPTARVGAHVVVGAGCRVGPGVVLHTGVVLGAGVVIGEGSDLRPQVVVMDRCVIGRGCILHPHVTIGADGFGYRPDPSGRGIIKIPHAGTVELGDGVEVGANTAIDRGKFGATVVGDGTKIDNLCQIGHNVRIGRCCIICGHTAIGGSTRIGDGVTLAGCVAVCDNLTIGAGATLGALSGVISDVPAGVTWLGHPAGPHRETLRQFSAIRALPEFMREQRRDRKGGTDGR